MGTTFSLTNTKGNHYHKIINNLYIGDCNSIYEPFFSNRNNLVVVNATRSIPFNKKLHTIANIRIPVEDDMKRYSNKLLYHHFNQVTNKINYYLKNDYTVLVHCVAGRQRSCSIVAAYLMRYKNCNYHEAIEYIKKRRPFAFFLNVNFKYALHKWNSFCINSNQMQ